MESILGYINLYPLQLAKGATETYNAGILGYINLYPLQYLGLNVLKKPYTMINYYLITIKI